jgi:hypothetical protein
MGKKLYSSTVLKEAIRAQEAWKQIDEELAFGNLKIAGLAADIEDIYQTKYDLAALENQLTEVRNRRDELYLAAWEKVKRMRAGIKGTYGDDSSEYELVGGTRRSERKRARHLQPAQVQVKTPTTD